MAEEVTCGELRALYRLLGKKWTMTVLSLLKNNSMTYNQFRKQTKNDMHPTLLSQRLKDLENLGLLSRKIIDQKPIYSLTKQGIELEKMLHVVKKLANDARCNLDKKG